MFAVHYIWFLEKEFAKMRYENPKESADTLTPSQGVALSAENS